MDDVRTLEEWDTWVAQDEHSEIIESWTVNGRECRLRLVETPAGQYYCGYTVTEIEDCELIEREIDVYGGVTYYQFGIIGFDCASPFDICIDPDGEEYPSYARQRVDRSDGQFRKWSVADAKSQVVQMADQLDELEGDRLDPERDEVS